MISTGGEEANGTLGGRETSSRHGLPAAVNTNVSFSNSTGPPHAKIIVRTEEVVIVTLVLVLWVAAIALFFNRWGKIRMLEPYQPKFIQQHRPSCPLVDPVQHRSFSKFNISGDLCPAYHLRPRQNSVFVGSSIVTINPPRKVKSAFDLQNLILSDPALNRSVVKLNLSGDEARRLSLRTTLNVYPDSQFDAVSPVRNPPSERRLSFKDLVEETTHLERVQCCVEREPTDGELSKRTKKLGELRQNKSMSNQSSVSESRHNSITCQDLKVSVQTKPDRRSSLLTTPKDGEEHRSGVSNFRRNSAMFINSLDADRNYLLPRNENIKSGVIDFRRNSMLIINNLNEDIGVRPVSRNMSLGGSNMNLGLDFPSARRSSVIPPFGHEHKPKVSVPHVSIVKTKPTVNSAKCMSLNHGNESKLLVNQKASKSLDSGEYAKVAWRHKRDSSPVGEPRKQFLAPVTVQKYVGSTSSLNAESSGRASEERRTSDECRSTGNLAMGGAEFVGPVIVETTCPPEVETEEDAGASTSKSDEADGWRGVNLTTSLSNVNISSAIPLNVITSSGAGKKTSPVEMSHV